MLRSHLLHKARSPPVPPDQETGLVGKKWIKKAIFVKETKVMATREIADVHQTTAMTNSEFPVTREGANFVVGNPEIVQTIMGEEGGKIEVMARLQPD